MCARARACVCPEEREGRGGGGGKEGREGGREEWKEGSRGRETERERVPGSANDDDGRLVPFDADNRPALLLHLLPQILKLFIRFNVLNIILG